MILSTLDILTVFTKVVNRILRFRKLIRIVSSPDLMPAYASLQAEKKVCAGNEASV